MVAPLVKIVSVLCLVVLLVGGYVFYSNSDFLSIFGFSQTMPVITFNQKTPLRVEVVRTVEDLQRGLSGRESLDATDGMLFVFPQSDFHGIWMKGMHMPIDIIWVDENGTVVDVRENVTPDTFPKVFEPSVPARFVVEARAYFSDSFSIKVGDTVQIPMSILPEDLQK